MSDTGGTYEADVSEVTAGAQNFDQFAPLAKNLGGHFKNDIAGFRPWPGYTDDYARKMGPNWDQTIGSIEGILDAVVSGLTAVCDAVVQNANSISSTDAQALDDIAGQSNEYTGGSRH